MLRPFYIDVIVLLIAFSRADMGPVKSRQVNDRVKMLLQGKGLCNINRAIFRATKPDAPVTRIFFFLKFMIDVPLPFSKEPPSALNSDYLDGPDRVRFLWRSVSSSLS